VSKAFDPADWARRHIVEESATATAERIEIRETPKGAAGSEVLAESGQPTKRKIKVISPGWGSSGYYSREVLERDIPRVFPKGTHMYLNHPSMTEDIEQPERRVEDIAGVLTASPVAESDGSMWAEARIFDHHAEVINALAEDIGVSIRAWGEMEEGERDGKEGPIILGLHEGKSIDFVTAAGRGGEVGPLIESAREQAIMSEIEKSDWKPSDKVREMLIEEARAHLEEERTKGADESEGRSGGTTTKEDVMSDEDKQKLSEMEDRLKQLETRAEEAESKTDEANQRAERAEDALARERAKEVVAEALDPEREVKEGEEENALPELPERARKRVVEAALKGDLPLDEDGKLDRDKITERARKAAREEAEYLNGSSESGQVRGVGASVNESRSGNGDGAEMSEATEKKLVEHFRSRGMSEEAAKIAAKGR